MKLTDWNGMARVCLLLAGWTAISAGASAQEAAMEGMLESGRALRNTIREDLIPQAVNGSFLLPALDAPSTTVDAGERGQVPKDFRDDQTVPVIPLPESGTQREAPWNWTVLNWEAPNTFSNPRYFEDRMLERHGHQRCGHLQPLASGTRFFLTIPMMPYLMTVSEPCECEYTLGYFRPGSRAPALFQRPPYERRALVMEGLAASGLVLLIH
jgi:hypothetical protein